MPPHIETIAYPIIEAATATTNIFIFIVQWGISGVPWIYLLSPEPRSRHWFTYSVYE